MLNINNINKYRKLKNISYDELSKKMGFKTSAGFRYALKYNTLNLEQISKLANILNVEIAHIYEDEVFNINKNTVKEPSIEYHPNNDVISVLQDEIKVLNEQIKQKDYMIDRLLKIIEQSKKTEK